MGVDVHRQEDIDAQGTGGERFFHDQPVDKAMPSEIFTYIPGNNAVLVSIPHAGLFVPEVIRSSLSGPAQALPDTDWHVGRLYDEIHRLGVSTLAATHSRYVIDLNRPPDDTPLYAGATTGLCPTTLFDGTPLYRPGHVPNGAEIRRRLTKYWQPYHDRISSELARIKERFGYAILFDVHSIRSHVPRLFDGRLSDLNVGTSDGKSADFSLVKGVIGICARAESFSHVLNGRFKGGYITRNYGDPASGIHAIQLELAQCAYMDEDPPFAFRADRAAIIRPVLKEIAEALINWGPQRLGAGKERVREA